MIKITREAFDKAQEDINRLMDETGLFGGIIYDANTGELRASVTEPIIPEPEHGIFTIMPLTTWPADEREEAIESLIDEINEAIDSISSAE